MILAWRSTSRRLTPPAPASALSVKVRDAAVAEPPREAGPAEARIFRAAVAICAIAALDDAFVHREPGTSAGDHLASGLAPAGVALVLALFYPRVRAGREPRSPSSAAFLG